MLANRVYREFKKIKEEQVKKATSKAAAKVGYIPPPDEHEQKGFELQLFGQSKYWKVPQKVNANTSVRRVKELYKAESGVGTNIDDIYLISKAKVLPDHSTLGQCGITNERHLITVKFKAHGGAYQSDSDDDDDREREIQFEKYKLKESHDPDCLIGYDDDDDIPRAWIGCKGRHAMAAETMYNYIIQCLEKNIKAVTIPCPFCKTVLDWDTCTQIADMTGKEYAQWTRVVEKRLEPETKTCPNCKAGCQRKQGVIIFRMSCSACKGVDWCWNCLQPWKGGGLIYCSNANCALIKDVNKSLREAPLFTPAYLPENSKVRIPKTRACPMCLTFMEHIKACKHMKCVGCTGDFCFICLGKKDKASGKWPCNSHTYECNPAPVQVFK
eukprot:546920_1